LKMNVDMLLERIAKLEDETGNKKPKAINNKQLKAEFGWSDAKIYRLRCKGIIKSKLVSGTHYYNYEEVMRTFGGINK